MNPKISALRPENPQSKVRLVTDSSPHPLASSGLPRLTVVIVNYDAWPDVSRLVATLAETPEVRSGRCDVIVVDNASRGPVPSEFASPRRGVRLILRPDNGGFAVGVNAGWRASRSPWLLLLNPDVEVDGGFLHAVLGRIDAHEGRRDGAPGVIGFALRNADGSRQPSVGIAPGLVRSMLGQFIPRSRRKYQADWRVEPGPVPWVTGACLLVDSDLMRRVGGMDEEFFLYYEEVALCQSARGLGRRVEFDDSVSVVHLRPLQDRPISAKMRVIVRHAKLLYFRKHLPGWQFRVLCKAVACEAAIRGRIARWRDDVAEIGSWRAIGSLVRSLRRGDMIVGRDVLSLAESATSASVIRGPRGGVRAARAPYPDPVSSAPSRVPGTGPAPHEGPGPASG